MVHIIVRCARVEPVYIFLRYYTVLDAAEQPASSGEIGACSFGVVLFRALGGEFSSVAPSALHMPGAFSR